jgi:tetratricopeptide repeat protein 21B
MTVKFFLLKARINKNEKNYKLAVSDLHKAKELQNQVLSRLRDASLDQIHTNRSVASDICFEVGTIFELAGSLQKAKSAFIDALEFNKTNQKAMESLTRLYLALNDLEKTQSQALDMLRIDPGNEEASMILAELLFQKEDVKSGLYHFQQLLNRYPDNFPAMEKLLSLLKT